MTRVETFDAIVVGAGPAGLAATAALAGHGLTVRLIDEQPAVGGQIWRGATTRPAGSSVLAGTWAGMREIRRARTAAEARRLPGVAYAAGATVIEARTNEAATDRAIEVTWLAPGRTLDRTTHEKTPDSPARGLHDTRARALVVATGAMERPLLLSRGDAAGGDGRRRRPERDEAGRARAGRARCGAGRSRSVAGADAVAGMAARRPRGQPCWTSRPPYPLRARLALAGDVARATRDRSHPCSSAVPHCSRRHAACPAHRDGRASLPRTSAPCGRTANAPSSASRSSPPAERHELPCRLLAVHDGVVPNVQLTRLLGLEHRWRADQQAFAPLTDEAGRAGEAPDLGGGRRPRHRGCTARDTARSARGARHRAVRCGPRLPTASHAETRRLRRTIARRLPARRLVDRLYPALPIARHANPGHDRVPLRGRDARDDRAGDLGRGPSRSQPGQDLHALRDGRLSGPELRQRAHAHRRRAAGRRTGRLRVPFGCAPPLKPTLIGDYLADEALDDTDTPAAGLGRGFGHRPEQRPALRAGCRPDGRSARSPWRRGRDAFPRRPDRRRRRTDGPVLRARRPRTGHDGADRRGPRRWPGTPPPRAPAGCAA